MDLQSQDTIGDFPVWPDLSLFPCLLLGSVSSGWESENCGPVLWGMGDGEGEGGDSAAERGGSAVWRERVDMGEGPRVRGAGIGPGVGV